ncbi:putative vacuolar iron transporter protein [Botrytis cinerea BcDW1]|uniref:Putative vacuolar iron transporter protein n=1 Tax=Botryotinia fuckeliana (strain BcDW1) TaxID=1290391 RepID=M7TRR9_BOTF1|nr:putative vacuolar iron transporter protein [Botrytis cinerea BcDW1]
MVLAVLKNIFFYQSVTPKSPKSNRERGVPKIDFITSRQPLLPPNTNTTHNSESVDEPHDDDESTLDLESQDSRSEKSSKKKGWRIDARVISDATIGLSDGLTVPFALTAGLSAFNDSKIVIGGGMAELIAGAISMGLGGYLAAKSELASYHATREKTLERIETDLQGVLNDLMEEYEPYEFPKEVITGQSTHLAQMHPELLTDYIMQFQHCEEEPATSRAFTSALTISMGYFLGGLLPLLPYLFVATVAEGLYISVGVMVITLFIFGYVKTGMITGFQAKCIGGNCWGAAEMVLIGGVAAAAAMGLVTLFQPGV